MQKRKRQPYQRRGLQIILQMLRQLARDPKVPGRVRLEAIDRLATIDKIYTVEVAPPSPEEKMPQKSVEEVLAEWKSKMGGDYGAKSSTAASDQAGR